MHAVPRTYAGELEGAAGTHAAECTCSSGGAATCQTKPADQVHGSGGVWTPG